MIPTHPEAVAGEPHSLRWILPAGILPEGDVLAVPGALGALLAAGTVQWMRVDHAGLVIALGQGATWPGQGAAVRAALHSALNQAGTWTLGEGPDRSTDARLLAATEAVLAGRAGDFIRSHGGSVAVVSARDGVATVRLRGACAGCPAVSLTLQARVERDLREAYPELRAVRAA
ncbi:NifU family protein [Cryobacterium arcticum]|uniref:NifU family protein n=1 Tax=Cryobacterium arcticum TaxID=670052 RepID=UPI0015E86289|nr:NifU family protein [Cryobacterium arcticum]